MEELELRTTVAAPPAAVFELLVDFPAYVEYTEYLESVEHDGDGGVGTEYTLHFAWWRVTYSVRSTVTAIDRPDRIGFELIDGIDAKGEWLIKPLEESSTEIRFVVHYDPGSIGGDAVSLPPLLSLSGLIDRAEPYLIGEAERVVERVVADLEGEKRAVDVELRTD